MFILEFCKVYESVLILSKYDTTINSICRPQEGTKTFFFYNFDTSTKLMSSGLLLSLPYSNHIRLITFLFDKL